MPFAYAGLISAVVGAGTSIYGATQAGSQGASAADPFAGQRGQYQDQLSALMRDPSSITKTPGYQFQFDQGMQALGRGQAAAGNLGGGTANAADIQFGQGLAMSSFSNWEQMLAHLAGADIGSPGTAGTLTAQGIQGGYQGLSQGLGSIFSALGQQGQVSNPYSSGLSVPGGGDPYGSTWGTTGDSGW